MDYLIVGIIGIVIGSFLNVCIYRIPKEESIAYPPSHCSSCNHKLMPLDLVPIISYLFLGGKCRYCKEKISIRYPVIEGLNGLLYILIYNNYGITFDSLKYFFLVSLLIVIGMIDFDTQFVYTSTTVFGAAAGILSIIVQSTVLNQGFTDYVLGGVIGIGILGIIVFISKGMGQGDAEIAGVCGLFLGIKGVLVMLFMSVVLGGIAAIFILVFKMKKAQDRIAFGPFLVIGTIIYILYGFQIIELYIKYFFL